MTTKARVRRAAERMLPPSRRRAIEARRQAARAEAAARREEERLARRRRELLDSDPALREVVVDGTTYYGRMLGHFSATGAAAHNLGLVVDALRRAEVEYFAVPGRTPGRHVLGLRRSDRKAFLDAVRELYRGTALYAAKTGMDNLPADAALYADGALPKKLKASGTMRFGEILLGPEAQVLGGLEFACEVEFWKDGESLLESSPAPALLTQAPPEVVASALVSPRPNAVSDVLPADARRRATLAVGERVLPTFEDFAAPRIDTVGFPIDVVYTWVDGEDPELRAKRERFRGGPGPAIAGKEVGASRYTSHDELRYSLRSLDMYADFVRHVFIVTDGQQPDWLDTAAEGVTVVDHRDIFSDPSVLPVFNSHAIGTQLHHIDGLSDRYLYFNDDVFVGRPARPEQFFLGNGIARLPFSPFQFGLGEPNAQEPAPNSAGKNVRELLMSTHGRLITNKFMHTPHPQIKAVMQELEERFAEDVERTSRSRFRSVDDIAMGASLHHHYAYLTGRAVPGEFRFRYVDIGREDAPERLEELERTRRFDFFCLNDVDVPDAERAQVGARMHEFLERYFPYPSRFERVPAGAAAGA
ncbi:stealth family protein [Streptomyces sp. 549]|uniref:stealth family protein n=1 Tax=Streptomyces sp. 549 TaxID=3049076 RepID=UPI0024C42B61|nr:stealth family protein [Streptomyces sp. 549]MDK1475213.1 stealth family protein [Streptomyces sp. 549]